MFCINQILTELKLKTELDGLSKTNYLKWNI